MFATRRIKARVFRLLPYEDEEIHLVEDTGLPASFFSALSQYHASDA